MKAMCNWIKQLFSEKSAAKNIALLIISVIITVSFSTPINTQVDKINDKKSKTVSITFLEGHESDTNIIGILDNSANAPKDAFKYISSALLDSDIEYELTTDISGNLIILFDGIKNANKSFSFNCPYYSNTSIDFYTYPMGGKVRVDCDDYSREYDLFNEDGTELVRCTPISESYGHLIPYFAIYIPLFVLIVFTVYVCEKYILGRFSHYVMTHKDGKWIKYNIKLDTVIIFIALSAFSLISYYAGTVPRYLQGGDQNHYWYMIIDLSTYKEDSMDFYDFRGYWCYLGPALCRSVGAFFRIPPVAIWIVFMNLLAAVLLGITFPLLAKKLYGYSLTRPQVYFSVLVMCVLWRGLLVYVLMDLPAAVFFISGFTLYIYFLDEPSLAKGMLCGLCFGIASNLKVNYQFVSIILLVIWTFYFFAKRYKNIKRAPNKKEAMRKALKKIFDTRVIASAMEIVLVFVIVGIPQLVINKERGVISLTPFETEASYIEMAAGDEYYLTVELSASRTFENIRLYPLDSPTDRQVQGIAIDYTGNTSTLLRFPQLFEMFLRKPIDTLIMMAKKIILGMNVLNSSPYDSDYAGYQNSLIWLKCLLNYVVIFGGVYAAFRNRKNVKEKIVFWCMFLLCVLPGTIGHVEWRGFIVGYLFVNFYFCYNLMPYCADKSDGDTKCPALNGFYRGLSFFLPVMVIICSTIT